MTSLDPNSALQLQLPPLKSFSLTHILYDPTHPLSIPLTLLSLSPIFLFVSYFTLIIFTRRLSTLLLALGSIANEVLSWALKRVFKGDRPFVGSGELGHGYGMPSSHSQAAGFLVAWGLGHGWLIANRRQTSAKIKTVGVQKENPKSDWTSREIIRMWRTRIYLLGLVLWSFGVSYSRWHLLYHTPIQIIAGYLAGLLAGSTYFLLTEYVPLVYPSSVPAQIRRTIENLWEGVGGVGGWQVSPGTAGGGWGEGWVFGIAGSGSSSRSEKRV